MLYDILVKKSIIEEGVCIMAKILIVDDEPRIRELIREHLQYSGYICEEAADGTAALTQLSGGAFDLVILDLMIISCLRCSSNIFRVFQQFKQYWIALCFQHRAGVRLYT